MRKRILSLALTIAMMVSMLPTGMITVSAETATLPSESVDNSNRAFIPGFYVETGATLSYNGTKTITFKGGSQAAGIGGKGVNTGSGNSASDSLSGNMTFGTGGEKGDFKITAFGGEWGAGIGDGDTAGDQFPVTDQPRTITMNSGIVIGYAGKAAGIGTQDELHGNQMVLDFKNTVEGSFAVGASSGACGVGAGNDSSMIAGNLKIAGYVMGLATGKYVPISEQNTVEAAAIDQDWTVYSYDLTSGVDAGSRIYVTKEGSDLTVYDYIIPVGYTKLAMSFKVDETYTIKFGENRYITIDTSGSGGGFVNKTITPANLVSTTVNLGSKMSLDTESGVLSQGGSVGDAITPIKIKADKGYVLQASWAIDNGLTYTRNSSETATITGNFQSENVIA